MKKWIAIIFVLMFLSGCSWQKAMKWFDDLQWERENETIRIVNIFLH